MLQLIKLKKGIDDVNYEPSGPLCFAATDDEMTCYEPPNFRNQKVLR